MKFKSHSLRSVEQTGSFVPYYNPRVIALSDVSYDFGVQMYTKENLEPLDVEKHVIENQNMYFGSLGATAPSICSQIVEGALILGSNNVSILNNGDWSCIVSDFDWLNANGESNLNSQNAFSGMFPFPEAGINSCRFEYFAYVFSSALVIANEHDVKMIKGDSSDLEEFTQLTSTISSFKRILGFKFISVI
ncbi:MAG: hypothetical protein HRU18_00990 [Pseudoalteromonas sp.]|uniref:hypothetical protein n=1 Tax=Pseudoalteromonas sp. TaxID=53249 RepID=UPI001D619070|nr:hypothetical protein [Pseudoalteromonas sp.]NRA76755.1 hypothetical protein [Pseudoalteromonas sp.]